MTIDTGVYRLKSQPCLNITGRDRGVKPQRPLRLDPWVTFTETKPTMNLQAAAIVGLLLNLSSIALGQDKPATVPATKPVAAAPKTPPGDFLAQHDFFYAGESNDRKMFIIRKGQVVWSYNDAAGKGEISDATLLSNGNVLLAHQFAVKLVGPDKKVIWNYDAPPGPRFIRLR